jgi:hypothetical protein
MPPPPTRTQAADYHFYTYDYDQSQPFTPSPGIASSGNKCFFSMQADLTALEQYGADQQVGVPNIRLFRMGAQVQDDVGVSRDMTVLAFGGPQQGNAPGVVLTGGIHAREWVSPAIVYLIAEYLIKHYKQQPQNPYESAIKNLVDTRRLYFVPILNPNGNWFTVYCGAQGHRMWRKNRDVLPDTRDGWFNALQTPLPVQSPNPPFRNVRKIVRGKVSFETPTYGGGGQYRTFVITPAPGMIGVDLNRNATTPSSGYNTPFLGKSESGDPTKDSFFGVKRASALETRNLQAFFAGLRGDSVSAVTAIDYHSYSKLVLYPTEAFDARPVDASYKNLGCMLQALIATSTNWTGAYDYRLGTPRELLGYDAVGTCIDLSETTNGARAFAIELDPAAATNRGFELPENQIMTVFEKNIRAALALIAASGQPSQATAGNGARHTNQSAEQQFLAWDVFGRGNQLPT